jgi:Tfp pilus assembly protein PilN
MRPIDLTPEEQRRGRVSTMRTGPLPFIVIGALVALLAGVALLVITSNEISDSKAEIAELKTEKATASAQAQALQPYVDFLQMERQRTEAISSLADSRFNWVRAIHELSLLIPADVWLVQVSASASPSASGEGEAAGAEESLGSPTLQFSGCATGQDAVAAFIASVKQIEGVTRVGLANSVLPKPTSGASGEGSSESCPNKSDIAHFEATIVFDEAPTATEYASTEAPTAGEEAPSAEASSETAPSE